MIRIWLAKTKQNHEDANLIPVNLRFLSLYQIYICIQLDEEIYTEICSNNHAVRVLNPADSYHQTLTSYNQISNSLSLTEQNQGGSFICPFLHPSLLYFFLSSILPFNHISIKDPSLHLFFHTSLINSIHLQWIKHPSFHSFQFKHAAVHSFFHSCIFPYNVHAFLIQAYFRFSVHHIMNVIMNLNNE